MFRLKYQMLCVTTGFLYSLHSVLLRSKYSLYTLSTDAVFFLALSGITAKLCVLYVAGALWKMADRGESLRGAL